MKNIIFLFSIVLTVLPLYSQQDSTEIISMPEEFLELSVDEMLAIIDSTNKVAMYDDFYNVDENGFIILKDVSLIPYPKFRSELEKRYYYWLKKKLYNAYPYYLKAMSSYENLNDSLTKFSRNKKLKKYIKKRQKQLADAYEKDLRGLTRTEGQILSKMIYRHSGKTTYEVLAELRGGVNAYIWQAQAGLFDIDLKTKFDPYNIREDEFLENILLMGLSNRELLEVEDFRQLELLSKRDTIILSPVPKRSALEFGGSRSLNTTK